jgi:hypothetical protein
MHTYYETWAWLDGFIARQMRSILAKCYEGGSDWLYKLVRKISETHQNHIPCKTFNPSDFELPIPPRPYLYTVWRVPWEESEAREWEVIVGMVMKIVGHWLDFPDDVRSRHKCWFIYALLHDFWPNILWLEQTWKAYNSLMRFMFNGREVGEDWTHAVAPLRKASHKHPLHLESSPERKSLDRVGSLMWSVGAGEAGEEPSKLMPKQIQSIMDH